MHKAECTSIRCRCRNQPVFSTEERAPWWRIDHSNDIRGDDTSSSESKLVFYHTGIPQRGHVSRHQLPSTMDHVSLRKEETETLNLVAQNCHDALLVVWPTRWEACKPAHYGMTDLFHWQSFQLSVCYNHGYFEKLLYWQVCHSVGGLIFINRAKAVQTEIM